MPKPKVTYRNPWAWVSSLYLAEGLPYVVVMTVSVIMYKGMGISNTDIALYTGWLYFPWVIKPLWSPVVDILKTRRLWIWVMQLLVGAGLAAVALTIPASNFFQYTLAFLWLLAFSSATHDIAADGFYMLATTESEQAFFVGIRSTFYRISMISGQGLLVILGGIIQSNTGLPKVQLSVEAKPGAALVQNVSPETAQPELAAGGKLQLLATSAKIEISPEPRASGEIQNLISAARQWNTSKAFSRVEQKSQGKEKKKELSFWQQNVSGPLGKFLQKHLGPEPGEKSSTAG